MKSFWFFLYSLECYKPWKLVGSWSWVCRDCGKKRYQFLTYLYINIVSRSVSCVTHFRQKNPILRYPERSLRTAKLRKNQQQTIGETRQQSTSVHIQICMYVSWFWLIFLLGNYQKRFFQPEYGFWKSSGPYASVASICDGFKNWFIQLKARSSTKRATGSDGTVNLRRYAATPLLPAVLLNEYGPRTTTMTKFTVFLHRDKSRCS